MKLLLKYIDRLNHIKYYVLTFSLISLLISGCGSEEVSSDNKIVVVNDIQKNIIVVNEFTEESIEQEINDFSDIYEEEKNEEEKKQEEIYEEEVSEESTDIPQSEKINFNLNWEYSDFSVINSGSAVLYHTTANHNGKTIAINAGHGTKGGQGVKTYCHPDKSPKTTGGSTAAGAEKAISVSAGMVFYDGTPEAEVTLQMAQVLKESLLQAGYDVLMIRDESDVQLDNIARTVIANNNADCHIALHWDGDNLDYDKGCFYISTPDGIKGMEPVASHWNKHELLGESIIDGLKQEGCTIYKDGKMKIDLTQTSFSTIPSVDVELGNASSNHNDEQLRKLSDGICAGINNFFK